MYGSGVVLGLGPADAAPGGVYENMPPPELAAVEAVLVEPVLLDAPVQGEEVGGGVRSFFRTLVVASSATVFLEVAVVTIVLELLVVDAMSVLVSSKSSECEMQ